MACVHFCKKESSFDLCNVPGFCVFVLGGVWFLCICATILACVYLYKDSGFVYLCKVSGLCVFVQGRFGIGGETLLRQNRD